MTGETSGRTVKSVEKMVGLIEIIDELNGARLQQLAEQSELAKSTVHGYVSTLESVGYLVKEGDQYQLGLRFLHLGSVAKHRKDIYVLSDQMTRKLSERTELSADFVVEQGDTLISVSCYQSGTQSTIGVYFDFHSSASGKAILMQCSESEIGEKVDLDPRPEATESATAPASELPFNSRSETTENTITSKAQLLEEIERSRERGYAINDQEIHEGLRAIATPIVAPSGDTVGALSLAGASYRFTRDIIESEASQTLLDVRDEFEKEIGTAIEYQY